jgi:hypothetical protein
MAFGLSASTDKLSLALSSTCIAKDLSRPWKPTGHFPWCGIDGRTRLYLYNSGEVIVDGRRDFKATVAVDKRFKNGCRYF